LNFPFFIAKRYLISRKKRNIINIISGIATAGVSLGTFALVVVLSVFNGFDGLIKSYFSVLDPDLKITSSKEKLFEPDFIRDSVLAVLPGIAGYSEVIEENALLTHKGRQVIASLKGVSSGFNHISGIDSLIIDGSFVLEADGIYYAVPGVGVAASLDLRSRYTEPIHVYVPRKGLKTSLRYENALNYSPIYPSGIFSLLEEVDSRTVFVPIAFAENLTGNEHKITSLEVKVRDIKDLKRIKREIEDNAGPDYLVRNKYQQHDMLYKTMKAEKWVTYLILVFIVTIASFNILGSLSMLIIDKKEDILILHSMGATKQLIKRIFLVEGWLISIIGAISGLFSGTVVCLIQYYFEIISLPGNGSFVISAYPVHIQVPDLFVIFGIVLLIGLVAAWYPVRYISRMELGPHLSGI
jgi:lipoprotein-releasing system permease protein